MKYHVVVISMGDPNGWWMNTILERGDFSVRFVRTLKDGFRAITRGPCDLFILEDWPPDPGLPLFIEKVRNDLGVFPFTGMVLTPSPHPSLEGEPVQCVLSPPFTPEALNDAIARILGLPTRVQRRYLMRMVVGMHGRSTRPIDTVITLNINAGGMLVESMQPLPVGRRYHWSFSAPKVLKGVCIPGRVLRDVSVRKSAAVRHYIIQFDRSAKEQRQVLGHYLAENC